MLLCRLSKCMYVHYVLPYRTIYGGKFPADIWYACVLDYRAYTKGVSLPNYHRLFLESGSAILSVYYRYPQYILQLTTRFLQLKWEYCYKY